jgi:hypothetical protein
MICEDLRLAALSGIEMEIEQGSGLELQIS